MIVLVVLLAFAVCYFLYQALFYSCPSPPPAPAFEDETIVHHYADRYLRSLDDSIDSEFGIAADELFAFMYMTGIITFHHKGKTFVIRKQLLA
jgi:hypothetical protein